MPKALLVTRDGATRLIDLPDRGWARVRVALARRGYFDFSPVADVAPKRATDGPSHDIREYEIADELPVRGLDGPLLVYVEV